MAIAALLVLLVIVAVVAVSVWTVLLRPKPQSVEAGTPVQVNIPAGAGTREIAEILEAKGVVENGAVFRLRARLAEMDGRFKAGDYDLTTRMDYEDVMMSLAEGPEISYITVTIPEGFTIPQIAQRLEAKAGIPAAEFTEIATKGAKTYARDYPFLAGVTTGSLEGFLFPKTYRLQEGSTARDAIVMMLEQFESEFASVDMRYAKSKNLTVNDVVVIASMIEREARVAKERPLVSSVIYNRLRIGMRLEIDATVQYALGRQRKRLLYKHLEIDSPYNTYRNSGLPPGPIAAPGLDSIKAAAKPADTKYIYYVLTGKDGSHTFATNSSDFLRAKAQAKKGLR